MVSLSDRLRERIRRDGPISFRDWMASALYDPELGYYCRDRQRWGREGDYRTSPERSSLFAATFARYFVELYRELDSPPAWTLIEMGAGSGEFAAGVLETLQLRFPEVYAATRYFIDEVADVSRTLIQTRLEAHRDKIIFAKLEELEPVSAGLFFSNELLDAFPVHRVTLRDGAWREFFVEVNEEGEFAWQTGELSAEALVRYFAEADITLVEGQITEVNLQISAWAKLVAAKLERGFVITVDYGAKATELYSATLRPEGTLRGFRTHQFSANVLEHPGEQDLTTTVDWSHVMRAGEAAGLQTISFDRQDQFLLKAELLEELELKVSEASEDAERVRLRSSAREMILPAGMAASFQVLVQRKS